MLIAQISDCHVVSPNRRAYGRVDTAQMLRDAIAAINALPLAPDLVIATGDLVQSGDTAEYVAFLDCTRELRCPLFPVAGNHDNRAALTLSFDLDRHCECQDGFVQYAIESPVRILVVDTITPGSDEPSLCAARLAWIEARLEEEFRPTLIALHHPPFPQGVAWLEPKEVLWTGELEQLIRAHPHVVRLIAGHVHRTATTLWAGIVASSAPSTAHQVFPDFTPESAPQLSFEAPGFLLHHWRDGAFTSYTLSIPGLDDRFSPTS